LELVYLREGGSFAKLLMEFQRATGGAAFSDQGQGETDFFWGVARESAERWEMNLRLRHVVHVSGVLAAAWFTVAAQAQVYSAYRVVYKTVYDEERVTAYRLVYETAYEDRPVTTMKPEWVTEQRQRTVRVAKPVLETSTRNEVHRVLRPVVETETRYQSHVVRKAVTETQMQDQNYLTYEPVTTMRTEYVDQGGFVDQVIQNPGAVRNRLQWLPGAYFVDPRTGTQVYHRGGLHWVPTQAPPTYSVARQYVPNVVERQVPQTSYVQKVVTQQTPVQVTRYVDEVVQQPVQVQVQKWVTEEITRPVTVTTQKYEYEDRVEEYAVQTMKWVSEQRVLRVPHTVAKWQPYTTTRLVPRTVAMQIPSCTCGPSVTSYAPIIIDSPATVVPSTPAPTLGESIIGQKVPAETVKSSESAGEPTPAGSAPADSDATGKPSLKPIDPALNTPSGM
jgi:hypothetical protein